MPVVTAEGDGINSIYSSANVAGVVGLADAESPDDKPATALEKSGLSCITGMKTSLPRCDKQPEGPPHFVIGASNGFYATRASV